MLRALHWFGGALALAGVIFVGQRLWAYSGQIDLARLTLSAWIGLACLATTYAIASPLQALAWRNLLAYRGEATNAAWAVRTYGISQLAKYVPGNVAQFIGRQAIGAAAGLAGWPLAQSALWELGMLCVAGAIVAVMAAPLVTDIPPEVALPLFGTAVAAALLIANKALGARVAAALLQQIGFLVICGLVFVGTLLAVAPALEVATYATICGAYVVAWLAGLVTPGAPAGVGVREAVLLFLLRDLVEPEHLLLAIVAARIICVIGDCLFFVGAWMIRAGQARP
ncbi:MAG: hypothetical protein ACO1OG_01265 [Devosia sp.]